MIRHARRLGLSISVSNIGASVHDGDGKPTCEYKLLFHCGTKLVDTFTELYPNAFTFEGNRSIVFHKTADLPIAPLKHCISMALTYHRRKKLPMLGAAPHC